jgi:hypothetical protein
MATPVTEILTSLTSNVSDINSKEDFENCLNSFNFYKVELIRSDNFFDFPQSNQSRVESKNLSYTYLYEVVPNEQITSPIVRYLFLNSVNGPLILVDIFNRSILEQLQSKIQDLPNFIYNSNSGAYLEIESSNFIYFTFYPSINLSAVLISSNEDFFKHPIYSYNKVVDFFSR